MAILGRPRMAPEKKKQTSGVSLPISLLVKLDARADAASTTRSSIIRAILSSHFEGDLQDSERLNGNLIQKA